MPELLKIRPPNLERLRGEMQHLLELFDSSVREQEAIEGVLTDEQKQELGEWIGGAVAKRESIINLIIALENEETLLRKAVQSAEKMARRYKTVSHGLRSSIAIYMADAGIKRADSMTHFVVCKRKPDALVIENVDELPDECVTIQTTRVANKDLIRVKLEAGKEVPGAHLEPSGHSLTID